MTYELLDAGLMHSKAEDCKNRLHDERMAELADDIEAAAQDGEFELYVYSVGTAEEQVLRDKGYDVKVKSDGVVISW